MAFYKDLEKKTRQEKRTEAFARGGFEEEGSRRSGKGSYGSRNGNGAFGSDGRSSRPYGGKPQNGRYNGPGEHRGGPKPAFDRDDRGFRPYGDRPQNGRYNGPGEHRGGPKPAFDRDDRGFRPYGDRPQNGRYNGAGEHRGGPRPASGRDGRDFRPNSQKPQGRPAPQRFSPKPDFAKPSYEESRYIPKPETEERFVPKPVPETEPAFPRKGPDAHAFRGVPAQYGPLLDDDGDVVPAENLLSGRNPIREALKSGRDIEKLLVARGELTGSAREILAMAKERRIPIQEVDRARLDAITRNHQGMLAFASAYQYSTVEKMLELAKEREEEPFLILLDGITDPHNLGAIIRSAECAGAHGVIVQERRAVGLTPAAVKASAGAVEYIPVARVTNLANTIEVLKAQNIWVYAADMDGEDYTECDLTGPVALVIGAEGAGVGERVRDVCDRVLSLPNKGHVDSLNASVAAGILMYAVMQAR